MPEIFAMTTDEVTSWEKEHMAFARGLAGECMVLLENDGTLPITQKGNLALYGNGARRTVKGGTGSGDVNSRFSVNIEKGLLDAGFHITTTDWLDRYDRKREKELSDYREKTAEDAERYEIPEWILEFEHPSGETAPVEITKKDLENSQTDTAIYVIARNSGEGADRYYKRGDYLLFEEEKENLTVLCANYKNVILILNVGGVMDMSEIRAINGINSILLMSQLGNIGGYAAADVLTGDVTPSGKLADTWAVDYQDYPSSEEFSHNDGETDDEYYTEGIYVGYRYFDTAGVPVNYPFGYGKSYTDFELETSQVERKNDRIYLTVTVTNTGRDYAGKEVVQVYYSAPQKKLLHPYQELVAFEKTGLLAPGEKEELTICFPVADMASYSEKEAGWILEAGDYILRVGNSSAHTQVAAICHLQEDVVTEQLKNLFSDSDPVQEKEPERQMTQENVAAPFEVTIDADQIPVRKAEYQTERKPYTTDKKEVLTIQDAASGRCSVEELTAQLTVEEMAELCVGTMRTENESVIGLASHKVPGAAGDTSSVLAESRGIENLVLADGPAGLRLEPHFTEDGNDYYQYCTAIPIGWALAQSWNLALLEETGDMVGEEMDQFHVDVWLAPALNIHRNPLCGRNFEYFSEDPLIAGKTAAAITRGVQKHKGKGTTIKHFAANNQEDNRMLSNAHISERALREIYLKGFEIAVKESQPMSIMTSYNLVNGIHTANLYDLIQSAARDEWGFRGFIMTDWSTSQPFLTSDRSEKKYTISASTGCIYAGNDVQMPGCQKNVDDIIEAVKGEKEIDGYRITLADLQFNAANLIRTIVEHCWK